MKLSTSSTLFGISAFAALTPNHSALVSASESSGNDNNNNNNNYDYNFAGFSSLPAPIMAPPDFDRSLALIDPTGGRLSLLGLDPSEPLTEAEASFLEATIRDAFNVIHEEMGINLVAGTVAIAKDMVAGVGVGADDDASGPSSLRGGRKLPETDHEMCNYQYGPKKGQLIPDCIFDIEFYMDCYCHDCFDDDVMYYWNLEKPSEAPVPLDEKFFRFQDDDDSGIIKRRAAPSVAPSIAPSIVPSIVPSVAPTDNRDIGLEVERGPREPVIRYPPPPSNPEGPMIHPRPPSPSPSPRRKSKPFNKNVLKRLRQSPFSRFRKVKRVRFQGGN